MTWRGAIGIGVSRGGRLIVSLMTWPIYATISERPSPWVRASRPFSWFGLWL
jgi:hypothetical protein